MCTPQQPLTRAWDILTTCSAMSGPNGLYVLMCKGMSTIHNGMIATDDFAASAGEDNMLYPQSDAICVSPSAQV